ncbi:MAG: glycoside hydrolase family 3 C-terminal domain-containing protein, partial [Verrucomicrobia bacterium]|nr:glycoside hydrolase family 3 C-terminal domain-containing protein [Verrucomicrobiota bacterium]
MRKLKKVLPVVLSAAMVAQSFAISAMAAPAVGVADDGMYYTDFNTLADAQAAAADIAKEIAAEGDVLMKNEAGALPMAGGEFISLFGVSQDAMAGQSGNYSFAADPNNMQIREALEAEGFKVNRTLSSYYETIPTSFGQEVTQFNKGIENSFSLYKDAAVIVLSRGGGEGSDMATVTGEEASEEDIAAHAGYQAQADGKIYKHFLQLTDSEKALLEYVKAQDFKKIIYLVNCSEIFELGDLQNDEDVDAILWIGRPGQVGSISAAGILSGRINPSGKTVDTWYRDFTADPTWQNAINNAQVNSSVTYVVAGAEAGDNNEQAGIGGSSNAYHGVDYEEGIYVGYRYYETRGLTDGEEWYQNAVVYPFGYGLSYTNFSYSNMKVAMEDGTAIEDGATVEAAKLASSVEAGPAAVKTFTVCVDVTNEGAVAGKETVEIYVQAPYTTGEVEKAHVKLVGFGKTDKLLPGQTQTLEITVNVQDMASYDATDANGNGTKGYELDEGAYTLYAIANAHGWADPDAARYQAV